MDKKLKKICSDKNIIFYLPFLSVLGIVPLIVKMAVRENPLLGMDWYPQNPTVPDFFLYWKGVLLIASSIVMLILCVYYASGRRLRLNSGDTILIPVLVLTFFVVVSSLFSVYPQTTLHGMPDQYETVWVMIAYTICLIFSYMCLTWDVVKIEPITCILLACALPIELICVGQTFGYDFFRYLFRDRGYTFTFPLGESYGTFYNINYVGSYVILLLPCFVAAALCMKNIWIRIIAVVEIMMLLVSLYGSASSTGVIALAAAIGVLTVVLLVRKFIAVKYRKRAFCLILLLLVMLGLILGKDILKNYFASCDTELHDFDYVVTGQNDIEFGYRDQVYHLTASYVENEGLYVLLVDDEMNNIVLTEGEDEGGYYYDSDEARLQDLKIRYILVSQNPDVHGVELSCGDKSLYFSNEVMDQDGYYYYSQAGMWTKILEENQSKDFAPLNKLSSLANGRGYIWNKTLALLPSYVLFGSGADTYACVFPNDDFIDNMNNGYAGLIMTKPHNMYFQYAVQSGVLSLLCLLLLFGWYLLKNITIILCGDLKTFDERFNFALFLGFLGYMISGIANDSTVTVAPIFWTLFGLGLALENKVLRRYKETAKK